MNTTFSRSFSCALFDELVSQLHVHSYIRTLFAQYTSHMIVPINSISSNRVQFDVEQRMPDLLRSVLSTGEFRQVLSSVNQANLQKSRLSTVFALVLVMMLGWFIAMIVLWIQQQTLWACITVTVVFTLFLILSVRTAFEVHEDYKTRKHLFETLHLTFDRLTFTIGKDQLWIHFDEDELDG